MQYHGSLHREIFICSVRSVVNTKTRSIMDRKSELINTLTQSIRCDLHTVKGKKLYFNRTKARIAPRVTEKGRCIEYAITLRTATQCRENEKKNERMNVTKLNAFHRMGIYILRIIVLYSIVHAP